MRIIRNENEALSAMEASVLTLGNFDGVHIGHQELLRRGIRKAKRLGVKSVAVTFDPHPVAFFRPNHYQMIQPTEEKLEFLNEYGIDVAAVFPFTAALANLSPERFVESKLIDLFHPKEIVIGYDTTFGKERSGTPETMVKLGIRFGFTVNVVSAVMAGNFPVSSSRIRKVVQIGDMEFAEQLLGRPFELRGKVIHGQGRGGKLLGFPTANIECEKRLLPPKGVYAVWVYIESKSQPVMGALSIGLNPTFEGDTMSIEVFLLDFDGDLYGKSLSLHFQKRLRAELRFDSPDALKAQIAKDVEETRNVLG